MELNNEEVKKILGQSFDKIMKMADERDLSFDEIKDLLAEVLYDITVYGKKENTPTVEEITVNMPQILYGPPPVMEQEAEKVTVSGEEVTPTVKEVSVKMPQILYGPPPVMEQETEKVTVYDEKITPSVKEVSVTMPQVLYGPPPVEDVTTYEVEYDPSSYSQKESDLRDMFREKEDSSMEHGSEYIPGTNIWKPRDRGVYESDEDYVAYLNAYYSLYFPDVTEQENNSEKRI